MDIEQERQRLQRLLDEINDLLGNKVAELGDKQKGSGEKNISIKGKGVNETLWVEIGAKYNIGLRGKAIEKIDSPMYIFMLNITKTSEPDGYGYISTKKQPKWKTSDFDVVKEIVYFYFGIEKENMEQEFKKYLENCTTLAQESIDIYVRSLRLDGDIYVNVRTDIDFSSFYEIKNIDVYLEQYKKVKDVIPNQYSTNGNGNGDDNGNLSAAFEKYKLFLQSLEVVKQMDLYDVNSDDFYVSERVYCYFKIKDRDIDYPTKAITKDISDELELPENYNTIKAEGILKNIFGDYVYIRPDEKPQPDIWKISHGQVTADRRGAWLEKNQISLHKDTKKGQAKQFRDNIKIGDIVVLSYSNNIKRLVAVDSDVINPDDDWICREYTPLKTLSGNNPYKDIKKGWTPNYRSTCAKIPKKDYCDFESLILKPFFDKKLKDIGIDLICKEGLMNKKLQKTINLLKSKNQIILQGSPGTGKTRLAIELAYYLLYDPPLSNEEEVRADEIQEMNEESLTDGQYKLIQFHPAYSYEDFVRGIMASNDKDGKISYETKNKVLAEMAENARKDPDSDFVLIIDEINRANLSAVLGELIYALEYRGQPVESMYAIGDSREIILPENLYIIGTMNTADRSVGHIDYAIRRRFAFVDVKTNESVIPEAAKELFKDIEALFEKQLSEEFDKDDVMIGHSYFLGDDLAQAWEYEIKPILYEYVKDGVLTCTKDTINALNVN